MEQDIALWDPHSATETTSDPFKTLFVSRINFYTSESKLRREFEQYGPIKAIKMVHDKNTGKPRGYAFIEFEQEKDMHCKYWISKYGYLSIFFTANLLLFFCIFILLEK